MKKTKTPNKHNMTRELVAFAVITSLFKLFEIVSDSVTTYLQNGWISLFSSYDHFFQSNVSHILSNERLTMRRATGNRCDFGVEMGESTKIGTSIMKTLPLCFLRWRWRSPLAWRKCIINFRMWHVQYLCDWHLNTNDIIHSQIHLRRWWSVFFFFSSSSPSFTLCENSSPPCFLRCFK